MGRKKTSVFLSRGEALWTALVAVAEDEQLEVYDVERTRQGLRIFVERTAVESSDDKQLQAGVSADDCSRLCRRLMVYFSVEGDQLGIGAEPEIEVSSPGVNRHLRLKEHFVQVVGLRVKVKGGEATRVVFGNLANVTDDTISVVEEQTKEMIEFDLSSVTEARIDYQF